MIGRTYSIALGRMVDIDRFGYKVGEPPRWLRITDSGNGGHFRHMRAAVMAGRYDDDIAELTVAGAPAREIAGLLGLSRSWVQERLHVMQQEAG